MDMYPSIETLAESYPHCIDEDTRRSIAASQLAKREKMSQIAAEETARKRLLHEKRSEQEAIGKAELKQLAYYMAVLRESSDYELHSSTGSQLGSADATPSRPIVRLSGSRMGNELLGI